MLHKFYNELWIAAGVEQERYVANTRLLIQQVDRLSTLYLNASPTATDIAPADKERLETWLAFDQQFIEINKSDTSSSFEIATAARRVGFASLLLGRRKHARQFLTQAESRLSSLVEQYATDLSYRLEHASTLLQLAQLNALEGDRTQAKSKCVAALQTLNRETSPFGDEYAVNVVQLLLAAVSQLVQLDDKALAGTLIIEATKLAETQMEKHNPSPQLPILLEQCKTLSANLK